MTSGEIENVSFDSVEMGQQMPTSIYDPMPYIDEEQPIFPLGTAQVPDWAQSDLILATETCARNFLSQPLLIDSYFPPSVQLDISMGNTPIYDVPTLSRYFEESPSFIEINGLWDSQGSHFQGHATTPDVRSGIGASQANEPLSQDQAESLLTESVKDVYSDYDTCFGVVLAVPTSSFSQKNTAHSVPVNLKPFGGTLMVYEQDSDAYAGILNNCQLANALRQIHLKLDATLFISEEKDLGGINKPKMKKNAPVKAAREYSIRIVIYGLGSNKEAVGDLFSDAGCFLQQPYATEVIPGVPYDNPHYLVRPGAEMPKLENLSLDTVDDNPTHTEIRGEMSKGHFLRIIESAEADGGAVTVVNTSLSPRLRTKLMGHQIIALAMMHEKESGYIEEPTFPSLWRKELVKNSNNVHYRHTVTGRLEPRPIPAMGGILADDMGLGKTLSVLALICSSLDLDSTVMDQNQKTTHRGTLIVAPKSTIYSWMDQASEHIHEGQIRIKVYHGSGRESLANQFCNTDVVVTTYETLRSEWETPEGTRPLFSWGWLRVILDEAHHIRNRSRKAFRSVCDLVARYRWCLTGTPIHNSLDDYGALLSFIRVFPFVQKSNFMTWIIKPVEEGNKFGIERFRGLIRATCLRRTKQKTLELPPRFERVHEVHLHQEDQALYDVYKKLCVEKAAGQGNRLGDGSLPKGKEYNILSLILCLQRICDHGEQLLPDKVIGKGVEVSGSFLDLEMQQLCSGGCSLCGGRIDDGVSGTEDQDSICINCATSKEGPSNLSRKDKAAYRSGSSESSSSAKVCYRPSAKVLALLGNLKQAQAEDSTRPRKSVVFSSWVKMLDLVQWAFHQEQIDFQRIDGHTSLEGRRRALQEFNSNPDCTVMLATIGSSAEGVNLTVASVVHLLEPHWNPMVEAQAVDRVHRIGQTQEVTVIRYIVPNSVETYVQDVQKEKLQIINQAMDTNGITDADLEYRRWERLKKMLE